MSRETSLQILGVAVCLAAALVSYKLLAKHVTGSSGSAWFEAGCTAGEEAGIGGCATVLASPYSYWPPKKPDEPPGTPHLPLAFLGLIYFSMPAVWLIGVGCPSYSRRWFHLIPLVWVMSGLAISVRYAYIMYNVLGEWCPWCLLTHILNLFLAMIIVLLWPRVGKRAGIATYGTPSTSQEGVVSAHAPDGSAPAPGLTSDTAHPSWTRVLGTIGTMVIVLYGNYGMSELLTVRRTNATLQRCILAVTRIKADTAKLVRNWRLAEAQEMTIRPDDPVRTTAAADRESVEMVIFSDFVCPSCRRFATFLDEQIEPLFDGRLEEEDPALARGALKIVFKHYPLDTQCNAQAGRTVHPTACNAARIAEAVRLQAGNEAFWQAHDLLFARQSDDGRHDVEAIADKLGLAVERLKEDLASGQVTRRIEEDTVLAKSCGVRGTPAVFVEGRLVDPLAILEIEFWKAVVEQFKKETDTPRPASAEPTGQ